MTKDNSKVTITYSFPVATIVFLAFFIAKIFDKIDWSWWWVFSPFWIPFAIVLGILAAILVVYLILILIFSIMSLWK